MRTIDEIPLAEIEAARDRLRGVALRTPLVPLEMPGVRAEIHLKLENLQPIGSFKIRGSGNALALAGVGGLQDGVYTASAGNMAQGVAWNARRMGVAASAVVPENAPRTKLEAVERLGARIVKLPFDRWWSVLAEHGHPGMEGRFVHPVSDPAVIAGNGTIGLEILEDLPDVDAVLVPYGGGGLSCGIACALRALAPRVACFACEVETAAPLAAALAAGSPQPIAHRPSFVDGIGGKSVLAEMWPLARRVLAGSHVVSVRQAADAVRTLVERARVVAEGAGAVPLAVALAGNVTGKVVCVVSGGNIDTPQLAEILAGRAS